MELQTTSVSGSVFASCFPSGESKMQGSLMTLYPEVAEEEEGVVADPQWATAGAGVEGVVVVVAEVDSVTALVMST